MLCSLDGMPVVYDLVPANTDERAAAESTLALVVNCDIVADKGFIGHDWQQLIAEETSNSLITPKRTNQAQALDKRLVQQLNAVRERIEGLFHQVQNTGRHLEHLLAKTADGLCVRVVAKITSLVFRLLLHLEHHIDLQSFSIPH